jgi:hypothetical protein
MAMLGRIILVKLIPFSVPLAAAVGGLYWLIGKMM